MKRLIGGISIKALFIGCISTLILMILILIISSHFYMRSIILTETQKSFESLVGDMENRILASTLELEKTAKKAAYSSSVQTAAFTNQPIEYLQYIKSAENTLSLLQSHASIHSIFVSNRNNRIIYTDPGTIGLFKQMVKRYWPDGSLELKEPFFSDIFYRNENGIPTPYFFYVHPVYDIRLGEYERGNKGISAILCDMRQFTDLISSARNNIGIAAILRDNNLVVSSREVSEAEKQALLSAQLGKSDIVVDRQKYLSNAIYLPEFNWKFIFMAKEKNLMKEVTRIRNLAFGIFVIGSLLIFSLVICIIMLFSRPVRKLFQDMHNVRNGLRKHVTVSSILELKEIAQSINHTLDSIESTNNAKQQALTQLYQSIIEQNKAQLHAYQYQINPHFLFNTLECMRSMAHQFRVTPIEELVHSMSSIFSYSLYSSPVVSLGDELKHIRNYMVVMEKRFPKRYELRIKADPPVLTKVLPVMTLQPIIENCISHAFADNKKKPRIISIEAYEEKIDGESMLAIRIADNGSGITKEKLEMINRNLLQKDNESNVSSIGLYNVQKRIRLLFGDASHMIISSQYGYYTVVQLLISQKLNDVYKQSLTDQSAASLFL